MDNLEEVKEREEVSTELKNRKTDWIYPAVSFLLPVLLICVIFALNGYYPFGEGLIFVSDLELQYYPFISGLWQKIREGGSLLWSWQSGLGLDYLSLFTYYLSSPINFIFAILPHFMLKGAVVVSIFVKLGFSGLFAALYLKYITGKNDILLPVFALCYAFCSFMIKYFFNIIWLDSFALMPLVMLGFTKLMRERKFMLYTLTLAMSIYCNYYMGFYICVFIAMSFITECVSQKCDLRGILRHLAVVFVFSAIAIGLTAFLMYPAYLSVQNSAAAADSFPTSGRFLYNLYDVLGGFIAFSSSILDLQLLFSGMVNIVFAGLFLAIPKIALREKIMFVLAMVFMIVSVNQNAFDFFWNAFHYTRGLPYRYVFILSFILITAAYRAYVLLDETKGRFLWFMWLLVIPLLYIAMKGIQAIYVLPNIALCTAYFLITALILDKMNGEKAVTVVLKILLAVLILAEIAITANKSFGHLGTQPAHEFPPKYETVQTLLNSRSDAKDGFYRTDFSTWLKQVNYPALYGFNGSAVYSSTADVRVNTFVTGLGMGGMSLSNTYGYAETSPLSAMFLNLRYLVSLDGTMYGDGIYWDKRANADESALFENKYYLPLGFMVDSKAKDYTHPAEDHKRFDAQNNLFNLSTGLSGDLFKMLEASETNYENYYVTNLGQGYYNYAKKESEESGRVEWIYEMPESGSLFVYVSADYAYNPLTTAPPNVTMRGEGEKEQILRLDYPYIFAAGSYSAGEKISLFIEFNEYEGNVAIQAGYIDHGLFEAGYEILADETMQLTNFTDTNVKGTIKALTDGLLYTSIPANKNWNAYVDGVKHDIAVIDECMAALELTAGEHEIEFRYYNADFTVGIIISTVCAGMLAAAWIFHKRLAKILIISKTCYE
ncbi:MAG: YfhO family protein [Clostridiales bacterium]|jgi:uncharacterized membrane protein YfhO|nr:YfhO family protein [Clostridiales bacterium]